MMLKIIGSGLLLLFTIATGVWLHNLGRPLHSIMFTFHKLLALASVVFTAVVLYNVLKGPKIESILFILMIVTGLSMFTLFISGALLSIRNPANNTMLMIHNLTTILAVIATAVIMSLLVR